MTLEALETTRSFQSVSSNKAVLLRLLELARLHTGSDLVWSSRIVDGHEIIEAVNAESSKHGFASGQPAPYEFSLLAHDTGHHDDAITTFVGAPIQLIGAASSGMLCCVNRSPKRAIRNADPRFLELLADSIARVRVGTVPVVADDDLAAVRQRVAAAIAGDLVQIVHQPIIGLAQWNVIGAEALARFPSPPTRPDLWFADAHAVGLGLALELSAVRAAIATVDDLPNGTYLAVNASPELLCSPDLHALIPDSVAHRIVVELTEHAAVGDYNTLITAIAHLRERGMRLAIDDVGAGFASFNHVLRLAPDIVKLDMTLTRGIDTDVARRGLARGLLGVAHDIGATVVAEGVETRAELDTLVDLGVHTAQGYFLARPASLPLPTRTDLPAPTPHRVDVPARISDSRDALALLARTVLEHADVETIVRPILDTVLTRAGLETSYLTIKNPVDGSLDHRFVKNGGSIELPEGVVLDWNDTLCKLCRDSGILWTADVPRDLPGNAAAEAFGVQTFVSIPVQHPDGTELGTLCAASTKTQTLSQAALAEIITLATIIAQHSHRFIAAG